MLRKPLGLLLDQRIRFVRPVLALSLVVGGLVSFLPVLGVWMLPLGLLLLALDIPALQGPVARLSIRARRFFAASMRSLKEKRSA